MSNSELHDLYVKFPEFAHLTTSEAIEEEIRRRKDELLKLWSYKTKFVKTTMGSLYVSVHISRPNGDPLQFDSISLRSHKMMDLYEKTLASLKSKGIPDSIIQDIEDQARETIPLWEAEDKADVVTRSADSFLYPLCSGNDAVSITVFFNQSH